MTTKRLYWIDDEARLHPTLDMFCPDGVELKAFAGTGLIYDFFDEMDYIKENYKNCFFLIDILMPVPHQLDSLDFWDKKEAKSYTGINRNEICGIALANFITKEISGYQDEDEVAKHMRLITSFSEHVKQHFKKGFKIHNTTVTDKLMIGKSDARLSEKLIELTSN